MLETIQKHIIIEDLLRKTTDVDKENWNYAKNQWLSYWNRIVAYMGNYAYAYENSNRYNMHDQSQTPNNFHHPQFAI